MYRYAPIPSGESSGASAPSRRERNLPASTFAPLWSADFDNREENVIDEAIPVHDANRRGVPETPPVAAPAISRTLPWPNYPTSEPHGTQRKLSAHQQP